MKKLTTTLLYLIIALTTYAQPNYDYSKIHRERLGRGLVCLREGDWNILSWRLLKGEEGNVSFNVYQNDKLLTKKPLTDVTFFRTKSLKKDVVYEVRKLVNGVETGDKDIAYYNLPSNERRSYVSIPLNVPQGGITPDGRSYSYTANDASVGDVDGDGEYEIILKWEPTNAHDNSHDGYTGNVLIDCYKIPSSFDKSANTLLWRIDLGRNIRAGAHYTQFLVYDFDSDGKAEIIMKTADGTIDGKGSVIGDSTANHVMNGYINKSISGKQTPLRAKVVGRILSGPEYLTVFNGRTGAAMKTVDYLPGRGIVADWGDSYGNRSERYLACVAYLDGVHPSAVMCRGYYTQSYLAAWDWDGKDLKLRWMFDSDAADREQNSINGFTPKRYSGQGNHNLRVADVDGDGCDEITYGSMAVDNDGTGLYTTGMGHGDAIHQFAFIPNSKELQIWDVHENKRDGSDFRDAKTGKVLFQIPSGEDVGRGMAADIDPTNYGLEMWSASQPGYFDIKGVHHNAGKWIPQNSAVWWDGDKLRELLDKESIFKYDWTTGESKKIFDFKGEGCSFNNGTKQNPCLSADIFGDWREEVIVRTRDNKELRIYTTTIPTTHRYPTFMEDIPYRLSVATENISYNQPPEPGIYFGSDE